MSKKAHAKSMRVFARPNGSGKSTIIKEIEKIVPTGIYVNADEIEKKAQINKFINLGDYGLQIGSDQFENFYAQSTLLTKARSEGFQADLFFSDNVITFREATNSYEAAFIADFIRGQLITTGETFSFETVMSHPSKLETFQRARQAAFKNYLYFVSTASADINIRRVEERVIKGGHFVDPEKIRERYARSMELLGQMIPYCRRCFIFDNSLESFRLILEVVDAAQIIPHTDDIIPAWVEKYVLQKLGV